MERPETLRLIAILAGILLAAVAFFTGDFYWIIVILISILLTTYPSRKSTGFEYSSKIVICNIVTSVLFILVMVVDWKTDIMDDVVLLHVGLYNYVSALFMSLNAFLSGIMFICALDKVCKEFSVTKRWLVLYAMMFSLAVSVGSLFFDFIYLYVQGQPVFNLEVVSAADRISNNIMMVAPTVTTFSSAVFAVVTVLSLRGKGKEVFFEEGSQ